MSHDYIQTRWNLEELFPAITSSEVENAFRILDERVTGFAEYRPQLADQIAAGDFFKIIVELESITNLANRLSAFAALKFAENTQDQDAQAFLARVEKFIADVENRTLFFSLWWKALDEKIADSFIAQAGDYSYWLQEMRRFKPHTLSEAEEKIVNIKNVTGVNALANLYDSITNRYLYRLRKDGKAQELTRGELMVYVRDQDPKIRAAAYRELYRIFGRDGPILGQIYQALVRDWRNEKIELRHYASPIAARNLMNDIPENVVNILLDTCQQNVGVFQRYFRLKARLLGLKRLRRYDLYAPVAHAEKTFTYKQSVDLVLGAFEKFDCRFADLAQQVLKSNHIDSEVRKGKRSGAFCSTVAPELVPWVLLNFQGRAEDVATMAHELGHAVHSLLASHHSIFTQHASLPLAETASTFAEMLLIDDMLAVESDEALQRDLLFRQVDDAYATIQRQAFFAVFERQAHDMVHQNASIEDLSEAYLQNLALQFGDSVDVADEFRWEWVSIPHIYHVPFYVYAYAFGQLLVLSLYHRFRENGREFIPGYIQILSAGGSEAPEKILQKVGVDIGSPQFWQGGFDAIGNMIEKLELY